MRVLSKIFDLFSTRKAVRRWTLIILSAALAGLFSTLHFSENISDFLPLGNREREQFSLFQSISGAERIFIIFSNDKGEEATIQAIDNFVDSVKSHDGEGWFSELSGQFDIEQISSVADFVYDNAPYFLSDSDIERMDSLLSGKEYVAEKLSEDRKMLMFPSSAFVGSSISHDPLGLFTPLISRLYSSGGDLGFELRGGYIFTPDMSRAVVLFDSPFGSSETSNNSKLVSRLQSAAQKTEMTCPGVDVDIVGGPAIAVGNSSRIKKDSILAVCISVVLIAVILLFCFKSFKNILLIFFSVAWGLLFALGGLALFRDSVSIIVIGISSVILGIAVNYPLHLIAHSASQPDRKKALNEIKSPLIIGNITTVGAFLALVPLESVALRDLGLFASLLLVGTIVFVLFYLPHYVVSADRGRKSIISRKATSFSPEKSRLVVILTAVVTIVLSIFSCNTGFDTKLSNINYMTREQRRDMQYFEDIITKDREHKSQTVYIYCKGDSYAQAIDRASGLRPRIDSLENSGLLVRQNMASSFIVSREEQGQRLKRWNEFIDRHMTELTLGLKRAAEEAGFSSRAFTPFNEMLEKSSSLEPQGFEYFEPITGSVFIRNFAHLDNKFYMVDLVNVEACNLDKVRHALTNNCFDVESMNRGLTQNLSDNFNYICLACSLIVFFFLWFSFGRLELALISFIPMAVSWIWILGIMALFNIQFNIVNVILATFIFGQGDDYTIFITEGCQYEYARRKPILASYKQSIMESAAIMFVGIGTLIVAKHPALHSLAQITIIGMFSVVMMAFLVPPLIFNWLTCKDGHARKYPLTIKYLVFGKPDNSVEAVKGRYLYKGKDVERCVSITLRNNASQLESLNLSGMPTYEFTDDGYGESAILLALNNPGTKIIAEMNDEDKLQLARVAAEGFVSNIEFK